MQTSQNLPSTKIHVLQNFMICNYVAAGKQNTHVLLPRFCFCLGCLVYYLIVCVDEYFEHGL